MEKQKPLCKIPKPVWDAIEPFFNGNATIISAWNGKYYLFDKFILLEGDEVYLFDESDSRLLLKGKQKEVNLSDAINRVCEEIKNDKDYRIAWEANIAMAFKDAFDFSGYEHSNKVVHEVANKAAAAFLDLLIGKDMGDADGMAAVAKLHAQAKPTVEEE